MEATPHFTLECHEHVGRKYLGALPEIDFTSQINGLVPEAGEKRDQIRYQSDSAPRGPGKKRKQISTELRDNNRASLSQVHESLREERYCAFTRENACEVVLGYPGKPRRVGYRYSHGECAFQAGGQSPVTRPVLSIESNGPDGITRVRPETVIQNIEREDPPDGLFGLIGKVAGMIPTRRRFQKMAPLSDGVIDSFGMEKNPTRTGSYLVCRGEYGQGGGFWKVCLHIGPDMDQGLGGEEKSPIGGGRWAIIKLTQSWDAFSLSTHFPRDSKRRTDMPRHKSRTLCTSPDPQPFRTPGQWTGSGGIWLPGGRW